MQLFPYVPYNPHQRLVRGSIVFLVACSLHFAQVAFSFPKILLIISGSSAPLIFFLLLQPDPVNTDKHKPQ